MKQLLIVLVVLLLSIVVSVVLAQDDTSDLALLEAVNQYWHPNTNTDEALQAFNAILADDPSNLIALAYRANLFRILGRNDEALADAEVVLASADVSSSALAVVANFYVRTSDNQALMDVMGQSRAIVLYQAELFAREAMAMNPSDGLPYLALGRYFMATGDADLAVREFDSALILGRNGDNTPVTLLARYNNDLCKAYAGSYNPEQNMLAEAIFYCEEALRLLPEDGYTQVYLGYLYNQNQQYTDAVGILTDALNQVSNDWYAYAERARAFAYLGNSASAYQDINTALAMIDEVDEATAETIRQYREEVERELGRADIASRSSDAITLSDTSDSCQFYSNFYDIDLQAGDTVRFFNLSCDVFPDVIASGDSRNGSCSVNLSGANVPFNFLTGGSNPFLEVDSFVTVEESGRYSINVQVEPGIEADGACMTPAFRVDYQIIRGSSPVSTTPVPPETPSQPMTPTIPTIAIGDIVENRGEAMTQDVYRLEITEPGQTVELVVRGQGTMQPMLALRDVTNWRMALDEVPENGIAQIIYTFERPGTYHVIAAGFFAGGAYTLEVRAATTPPVSTPAPTGISGVWQGPAIAEQGTILAPYTLSVSNCVLNEVCGTDDYFTRRCDGAVTLVEADAETLRFTRESTQGNCPSDEIVLTSLGGPNWQAIYYTQGEEITRVVLRVKDLVRGSMEPAPEAIANSAQPEVPESTATSTPPPSPTPNPNAINGRWEGIVTQPGYGDYDTIIELNGCTPNQVCGTVDYPSLACGGVVTLTEVGDGWIRLFEDSQYGNCIDGEIVLTQLTLGQWQADYIFGRSDTASGVLVSSNVSGIATAASAPVAVEPTAASPTTPEPAAPSSAAITCPGAMPSRLVIGSIGRVIDDADNRSNRLRSEPGTNFALLTSIPERDTFVVLEGPVCADGYAWWRVNYNGIMGWTVESDNTEYWLEPLSADASAGGGGETTCEVTTLQGVNLRAESNTSSAQAGSRAANTVIVVNGQTIDGGGMIWWRVGDGSIDEGLWVREDLVREAAGCEFLPILP